MMHVLTIGGATQDIFINVDAAHLVSDRHQDHFCLPQGAKIEVPSVYYATGGGATNSAVSFKRLGFDVSAFFKIGNDAIGNFILNNLHAEGINTIQEISHDTPSGQSFILPAQGNRTILVYRGANSYIAQADLPFEQMQNCDCVYITSLSGGAAHLLPIITQKAKARNVQVANNPGMSQLKYGMDALLSALPYIDIFILNFTEAKQCWQSLKKEIKNFSIQNFCKEILSRGPQIVALTKGAEGVYVAHNNQLYFHPSLPTKVYNTVGAGDAFASCFVASILRDNSIEQALIHGLINASSILISPDAKQGLLTWQQLEQKTETLDLKLERSHLN